MLNREWETCFSPKINTNHPLKKIIKGCRKRQRKSQKELYELFYAYGMSISLRYTDTREQAVEILNDSFMKVFENIQKFDTEQPFKPWFRKIIINTAINYYHKNKNYQMKMEPGLHESNLSANEKIISGISYKEIIGMVQKLSPVYKMVFNLHVIEGYTHDEIADLLGIATGTSKSNLSKAKNNLRIMLERKLKIVRYDGR